MPMRWRRAGVVLDNLPTGFRFLVPGRAPFVGGSTGDRKLVEEAIARHRVDAIMHSAASIVMSDSVKDQLGYYRCHSDNAARLSRTC